METRAAARPPEHSRGHCRSQSDAKASPGSGRVGFECGANLLGPRMYREGFLDDRRD